MSVSKFQLLLFSTFVIILKPLPSVYAQSQGLEQAMARGMLAQAGVQKIQYRNTSNVDLANRLVPRTDCTHKAPSLKLNPANQNVKPGGTAQYTVSVTNNNSQFCGATVFGSGANVPVGYMSGM